MIVIMMLMMVLDFKSKDEKAIFSTEISPNQSFNLRVGYGLLYGHN